MGYHGEESLIRWKEPIVICLEDNSEVPFFTNVLVIS